MTVPIPVRIADPWTVERRRFIREFGVRVFLAFVVHDWIKVFPREIRLKTRLAALPLWCRTGGSDIQVFRQIFIEREYSCLDDLKSPGLIIDCGANVGYSSVYFLNRFPDAHVVAVEPDPANFQVLRKNLAPYGSRARAVPFAIWSSEIPMKFCANELGDGREWSVKVEAAPDAADANLRSVTINRLLQESGFGRISILKIDVEGAEVALFSSGTQAWLPQVDNLCVEIHSDKGHRVIREAVAPENFTESTSGELSVFKRPGPAS